MKTSIVKNSILLFVLIASILVSSCKKETINPPFTNTTEELQEILNSYYYWIDSIPSQNNTYSNPQDLLNAIRYKPKDKWSYITTIEEHEQYYVKGNYVGYGFGYSADNQNKLRITYLYSDSDFKKNNIERGWIIKKINGTPVDKNSNLNSLLGANTAGVSNNFEFESPEGVTSTHTFVKKQLKINSIIHKEIITSGQKKIGYFVFQNFIEPARAELNKAFSEFKKANVTDLVIDLRYNGGGSIDIANHIANLIIPENLVGKKFLTYKHNNHVNKLDASIYFKAEANSLKLSSVYFITSKNSASASESIINGLSPYINTYIIGNNTYGKPVGMYSFKSIISNLVYVPISFSVTNSEGFSDYYNGLTANSYVTDDVFHNFGSHEATLSEALRHITTGAFSSTKSAPLTTEAKREIRSIRDEIGAL